MDEILKQVATLINTGGELANDALYLYFTLKIIQSVSVTATIVGVVWAVCRMILRLNGKS
jgi:hypothetical protein